MLRLPGMAAAYSQQFDNPDYAKLTFNDRIDIIVKEGIEQRTIKRKQRRLKEVWNTRRKPCQHQRTDLLN